MAQSKVTEFFSTRKRNRFGGDDVLLNKQKKTTTLLDSPIDEIASIKQKIHLTISQERTTRSRTKQQLNNDDKSLIKSEEKEATKEESV